MPEYMLTRIGRETSRTRLSKNAAMQLRSVLRSVTDVKVESTTSTPLDRNCIGIASDHSGGEWYEIYDLSCGLFRDKEDK